MEQGGILTGLSIKDAVKKGDIEVDPWDPTHVNPEDKVNPASYDLTLGSQVAVYSEVVKGSFARGPCDLPGELLRYTWDDLKSLDGLGHLDAARHNKVSRYEMKPGEPFLLKPGIGYLMHTFERVRTDKFIPIIDGKSSIGRLFAFIHVTAGYGDPGFDGQYTLEVVVIHPLLVYPGMRFCQIRFHTMVGEVETYQGKGSYKGKQEGPVESMSWKMFHDRR